MRLLLRKATLIPAAALAFAFGIVGVAGATTDPNLTSATTQVTDYFSANLAVVIGVFIAVALVLWMFAKATHSVGIRGRVR
jgi:uncharacterized membrane protein